MEVGNETNSSFMHYNYETFFSSLLKEQVSSGTAVTIDSSAAVSIILVLASYVYKELLILAALIPCRMDSHLALFVVKTRRRTKSTMRG